MMFTVPGSGTCVLHPDRESTRTAAHIPVCEECFEKYESERGLFLPYSVSIFYRDLVRADVTAERLRSPSGIIITLETGEESIMREGMLWFDNSDEREFTDKIERAAKYYETKYGQKPTLIFVHPSMLLNGPSQIGGIDIRATNSVLPNHFWVGTADNTSKASAT
jgi:hypothetical protein